MANLFTRLTAAPTEERQLVPMVPTWSSLPETAMSSKQAYTASATVHAVMNARMKVFSEVRFAYRRANGEIYKGRNLAALERPWPGGTGTELLGRLRQRYQAVAQRKFRLPALMLYGMTHLMRGNRHGR